MTIAFYASWGGAGAEDLQGDDLGWCFVDAQQLNSFSDPEMDMTRVVGHGPRVRMWRLLTAFRWLMPGVYAMETPRRSVDRELEQFSSPWE
jgi:hypothetical protein